MTGQAPLTLRVRRDGGETEPLQVGDIALISNDAPLSLAIRLLDGTAYSHGMLALRHNDGRVRLFEGALPGPERPTGVGWRDERQLREMLAGSPRRYVDVYRPKQALTEQELVRLAVEARKLETARYGVGELFLVAAILQQRPGAAQCPDTVGLGVVLWVLRTVIGMHARKWFEPEPPDGRVTRVVCTEVIARCYRGAGWTFNEITQPDPGLPEPGTGCREVRNALWKEYVLKQVGTVVLALLKRLGWLIPRPKPAPRFVELEVSDNWVTPAAIGSHPDLERIGRLGVHEVG